MHPASSPQNIANRSSANVESIGEGVPAKFPGEFSNVSYVGLRKFGLPIDFTPRDRFRMTYRPVVLSALGYHVGCVVGGSSDKQMIGSDTRRVIALVADEEAIGDRTVGKDVRQPVCFGNSMCTTNCTVALEINPPNPEPAPIAIRLVNSGPEILDIVEAVGAVASPATELAPTARDISTIAFESPLTDRASQGDKLGLHREFTPSGVAQRDVGSIAAAFTCLNHSTTFTTVEAA